jgi:hypothetical protein
VLILPAFGGVETRAPLSPAVRAAAARDGMARDLAMGLEACEIEHCECRESGEED